MTTTTYRYQNHNPLSGVLFAVCVLALAAIAAIALPQVVERAHAEKHPEALNIRQCWERGDMLQRWAKVDLKSGLQRDYCLFTLPDKTVGCRIVQFTKAMGWLEVSGFRNGDGLIQSAEEYLRSHNCEKIYP